MCKRFIKFIVDAQSEWLQEHYPNAFLLLCVIARQARRDADSLDGLLPGDSIVGEIETSKKAGLSEKEYRNALEKLEEFKIIETVFNPKSKNPQKRAIKRAIKSKVVNLCNSEIWDINSNNEVDQKGNQWANKGRTGGDKQERIRKNKNKKVIEKINKKEKIEKADGDEFATTDNICTVAPENFKPPRYEGAPQNVSLTPEQHESFVKTYGIELTNAAYEEYSEWKLKRAMKEDVEEYNDFLRLKSKKGWPFREARKIKAEDKTISLKEKENELREVRLNNPQTFKPSFVVERESNREMVMKNFKHYGVYNGATCYIDTDSVAFERGMNHRPLKFSEKGFKDQFNNILRKFGITVPE